MTDILPRLLKSYEFFNGALAEHGDRLASTEAERLREERDLAFLQILTHTAADARVTVAQLRFILSNLEHLSADPELLSGLEAACARHLDRIAASLPATSVRDCRPPPRDMACDAHNLAHFDMLGDRVAILDTDYRYTFTNTANAQFHGEAASAFVGRPNWQVAGEHYFERVTRPRLLRCFAGERVSFISSQPLRNPGNLYSVTFDPLRKGKTVAGAIVVSRDVSHLPIPSDLNVYRTGC